MPRSIAPGSPALARHQDDVQEDTPNGALCPAIYNAQDFELARGGSGAWYAMELTDLLPHLARALHLNWDEAPYYAVLGSSE